jgi:hypothetical protein
MLQVFYLDVVKVDLDVAYTCMLQAYVFKYFSGVFIRMFASVSCGFCIYLQYCSGVFASVLDACFKCFICLLLYVAMVASRYFKSRSGVTHRIRVGSSRWRGRRLGRCKPTVGALLREPDALGACSLPVWTTSER